MMDNRQIIGKLRDCAKELLDVARELQRTERAESPRTLEIVKQWPSVMDEDLKDELEHADDGDEGGASGGDGDVSNDEYEKAKHVVITTNRASISHLQRQMRIGYNHAAKIIDFLEARGVIGPARGAGPREVLVAE